DPEHGQAALEELILTTITEVLYLGAGQLGPDDDFIAAGLDSILAVEFVQVLRDRAGTELAAKQLYDTRTARALAREILRGPQPEEPGHAAAPDQPSAANGAPSGVPTDVTAPAGAPLGATAANGAGQDPAAGAAADPAAHETVAARLKAMVG